MSEFELHRALRGLDRERTPSHDLWPAIAARIAAGEARAVPADSPRSRPRWPWLALAASLLLAVLVAIPQLQPPAPASAPLSSAPASRAATPAAQPLQARSLQLQADALTLEYVAALDQLGGQHLAPALAPALTELDSSATQIRAALRQDPGAHYLLDQLRRTYDQRLRLTQLALSGPTRIG